MKTPFQFIQPDSPNNSYWLADELACDDRERRGIFDALSIASAAAGYFRGCALRHAPTDPAGETIALPWRNDYWKTSADGNTFFPEPIGDEVEQIARSLHHALGFANYAEWPMSRLTFLSAELMASDQSQMQGLAVETLLLVERFFSLFSEERVGESWTWFSAANQCIFECACLAHEILRRKPQIAYLSANDECNLIDRFGLMSIRLRKLMTPYSAYNVPPT